MYGNILEVTPFSSLPMMFLWFFEFIWLFLIGIIKCLSLCLELAENCKKKSIKSNQLLKPNILPYKVNQG